MSQQADAARMALVIRDFLKMLAAAILCGLAVSIAAAGITLLLTGDADARLFQKEPVTPAVVPTTEIDDAESAQLLPTSGLLLLGDGCDNISLNAIKRDWRVRIDGQRVEVRVMQAFQLPAESVEVATFHVQLINGARMQRIAAQSSTKEWAGHVISADEYDQLTPTEYLNLARKQLLASHSPHGTVMASPIIGLESGDVITLPGRH